MQSFVYKQTKIPQGLAYRPGGWIRLDEDELSDLRASHGNRDILVSVGSYADRDLAADCLYPVYVYVRSETIEDTRRAALETRYYLSEQFAVPEDSIDISYDGDLSMMLQVPPSTFGTAPTALMQALNYRLARQMIKDGVHNVDIDVYLKSQFIRLPNTLNTATGRFVIPLEMEELLYLDDKAILELAKESRPQDSFASLRYVPEAGEWFGDAMAIEKKERQKQERLRTLLRHDGWRVPPCVKRLVWTDLSIRAALEACRVIAGYFALADAHESEIWDRIDRIDQRQGIKDYPRLQSIAQYAAENPAFVGCEHRLVSRFCPAGKCFMTELMDEIERPLLFGNK